jgi:hypothetical protein
MSCTPHRYSSNQIKLVIGMAFGMHVEDKHTEGFGTKQEQRTQL